MSVQAETRSAGKEAPERRFVVYFALVGALIMVTIARDLLNRARLLGDRAQRHSSFSELTLNFLLAILVCAASPQASATTAPSCCRACAGAAAVTEARRAA